MYVNKTFQDKKSSFVPHGQDEGAVSCSDAELSQQTIDQDRAESASKSLTLGMASLGGARDLFTPLTPVVSKSYLVSP